MSERLMQLLPGLSVTALGIVLLLWLIPVYVAVPQGSVLGATAPDTWPKTVSWLLVVLGMVLVVQELAATAGVSESKAGGGVASAVTWRRVLFSIALLFGYWQAVMILGMPLAAALAFVIFSYMAGERSWLRIGTVAVLLPVILHLFFTRVANIPMPMGFWE